MSKEFVEMNERVSWQRRLLWMSPVFLLLALIAPSPGDAGTNLQVTPDSIEIGTFFSGARVEVSAEIPAGSDAVIEVLGKNIEEQLLRKGRHWDIWMNVGEIDIEGAPSLYYVMSTDPAGFSGVATDSSYGYHSLKKQVSFVGDVKGLKRTRIFDEFIKLKESEKLYGEYPGTVKVSQLSGNRSRIRGTFRIPSKVAPGDYLVRLSVHADGRLVATESVSIGIDMVSLPAFLSTLALQHGALYGLLAVVVAVAFGYVTGLVFRKAGGGH
jgi:hypothetical protein